MFCEVKLIYLKDLINSRTKAFSSLRSAKELLEENMGWVTREGNNNKVKVRLVDLTSITTKHYPFIEDYGPLDEAINYAASGSDCIYDFVDSIVDTGRSESTPDEIVSNLTSSMLELQADLETIPGFVPEGYIPGSPWTYYFLGVTNQGKGLMVCVDETIREPEDDKQTEMPF